jgi:hypothetical protein
MRGAHAIAALLVCASCGDPDLDAPPTAEELAAPSATPTGRCRIDLPHPESTHTTRYEVRDGRISRERSDVDDTRYELDEAGRAIRRFTVVAGERLESARSYRAEDGAVWMSDESDVSVEEAVYRFDASGRGISLHSAETIEGERVMSRRVSCTYDRAGRVATEMVSTQTLGGGSDSETRFLYRGAAWSPSIREVDAMGGTQRQRLVRGRTGWRWATERGTVREALYGDACAIFLWGLCSAPHFPPPP